jgi:hypothetical protein
MSMGPPADARCHGDGTTPVASRWTSSPGASGPVICREGRFPPMAPLGGLYATQRCHWVENKRGRCGRYASYIRYGRPADAHGRRERHELSDISADPDEGSLYTGVMMGTMGYCSTPLLFDANYTSWPMLTLSASCVPCHLHRDFLRYGACFLPGILQPIGNLGIRYGQTPASRIAACSRQTVA